MANDIIFIGPVCEQWEKLKSRFPTAKRADDFEKARKKSFTKMFWIVWPDVEILPDFDFSYQPDEWSTQYTHVFKNGDHYDGICLINKRRILSTNEIKYRFFTNKKEVDIVASHPLPVPLSEMFDVVFISYNEPTADDNYQELLKFVPDAKRVHGVTGIHNAHIEAAKQCTTEMFWVVDGDARLVPEFSFRQRIPRWDYDAVHVWRSRNPVNDLEYGYGGVKLLPRQKTVDVDVNSVDMTTSISYKFKAVPEVSNVTEFNTDAFSSWRSAFRECVKLSSNIIRGQVDEETKDRLNTWCTVGKDRPFGDYAIRGALSGREYGSTCVDGVQLGKINNYDWLYKRFLEETNAAS